MAEKEINCDDNFSADLDSELKPALKPEIGRDLCRMKILRGRNYGEGVKSGDYGGYRKDILTENLSEREKGILICKFCKGIMKKACISERGEQFCSCCEYSVSKGPHTSIREMISSLKCSCPLIERGCKWLGTLEDCENHLATCGYVYKECKLKCGEVLRSEELERHEKENCTQRVVKCDHCDDNFISRELDGHLEKCPKMKVSCILVGCVTKITREDMELHLKYDCGMVKETCKLGCGVELTRDELDFHEKENCPQRFVKCDHCDKKIKSCQLNEHLHMCPKIKVSCVLCGTKITRYKMEVHLKHNCGMVQETCKLGCGVELTRDKLRIHEKENCPQRLVKCDNCGEKIKPHQLNGHYDVCPKMKVSCDLVGCDTKITREDMELHLKHDCGMVQETCKLGCGVELTRNKLGIHEKENCVQRIIQCEHCSIEVAFCDNSKHLKECPFVKLTCYQCGVEKYRKDMTQHFKDDCSEKIIDCPFVKYKCLVRMKRKDIDKHLEEKETKHFGMKLTAMEDLITEQSEINRKQSEEINKLNEHIEKQNKETTTEFSQQIDLLYFITDTTKIVWKIEDVKYSINYSSISKQYEVAGYWFALKFHYCGTLSIVFAGTTVKHARPFIAKCRIMLHTRDTINCGMIDVKQKDVTKGYEKIITSFTYEDINKYSEHEFPGATKRDLTLEIFITMQ